MANNRKFTISPQFDIRMLAERIAAIFRLKGMEAKVIAANQGFMVDIDNGKEGIGRYLGLRINIRVNMTIYNGELYVSYTDADWSGKITAFLIGCFFVGLPWIPMFIGIRQQGKLTRDAAFYVTKILCANPVY